MSDKQWWGIYQKHRNDAVAQGDNKGTPTGLLNGPFGAICGDKKYALGAARAMFGEDAHVAEVNPDRLQAWGPGKAAQTKEAFDTATVGEEEVELFFGDHPFARQDNNIYARYKNGRIDEFDGHRILWEVRLKEYNYLKESHLSGDQIREGGEGVLLADGVQVFEFFFRDVSAACLEARSLIAKLEDCPFRIWDKKEREKAPGRKVYYRDQPAVVAHVVAERGCVVLKPDGMERFRPPPWREGGDDDSGVLIEVTDPSIWWWRD